MVLSGIFHCFVIFIIFFWFWHICASLGGFGLYFWVFLFQSLFCIKFPRFDENFVAQSDHLFFIMVGPSCFTNLLKIRWGFQNLVGDSRVTLNYVQTKYRFFVDPIQVHLAGNIRTLFGLYAMGTYILHKTIYI